jgi:GDP-L-fucose synthase
VTVGYTGHIVYDISKPDGTPRKLMDISRLSQLDWQAKTPFADGLVNALASYQK